MPPGETAREHLRALHQFNWDARTAILDGLSRLPWSDVTATPAGGRSLRDAFLDLLETEAYWAHHVLDEARGGWEPYDRSNVTATEPLAMHAAGTQRATAERLAKIPAEELLKPRRDRDRDAGSAGEVLLRAASQSLLEAGVIAGRLRERGVSVTLPEWPKT